jgi:hypothetical protein
VFAPLPTLAIRSEHSEDVKEIVHFIFEGPGSKMTTYRRNPSAVMNVMRQRERKREYINKFNFPCCKELTNYEIVAKIGSGAYG